MNKAVIETPKKSRKTLAGIDKNPGYGCSRRKVISFTSILTTCNLLAGTVR
jgi:hypothetical protein